MRRSLGIGIVAAVLLASAPASAASSPSPTPSKGVEKAKGATREMGKHALPKAGVSGCQVGSDCDLIITSWTAG